MESPPAGRRRLRLSLRVAMLLVVAAAVWMGTLVNQARRQRQAVAAVKAFGGWVHYDWEFLPGAVKVPQGDHLWKPPWGTLTKGRTPNAPAWLRRALGDEYFQQIAHVSLFVNIEAGEASAAPWNKGSAEHVLRTLESQTGVKTLQIGGQQATDAGLAFVGRMTGLEELIVFPGREITDAGVAHLTALRNLKSIRINSAQLTDRSLKVLARLPRIETIAVEGTRFTDEGVAYLRDAKGLKTLWLASKAPAITDRSLDVLTHLPSLKAVYASGGKFTREALDAFKAAKPGATLDR